MLNSLKNLFRRNLPAKILALIGAVVLWGFVMNDQNPPVNSSFTVPVYTINEPDGYKVSFDVREISLRVRAPRASFASVNAADFKAYLDLADAVEGNNTVKVRTVVPQGFEVIEVSDTAIDVLLEAIMEKTMAVDVQITGNTGVGSALDKIIPSTEIAKIKGTKSNVMKVARLVGYMPLAGNTTDFTSKIKLTPVDGDGEFVGGIDVSPMEIDVTAKIMDGAEKKMISIKPLYSGTTASGYRVSGAVAQPERLEVIGKAEQLGAINEINTETISVDGLSADFTKDVDLVLPEGIIAPNKRVSVRIIITKDQKK